jgi:hypothetical protein
MFRLLDWIYGLLVVYSDFSFGYLDYSLRNAVDYSSGYFDFSIRNAEDYSIGNAVDQLIGY